MGWGRMLLLGDIGQQLDLRDLNRDVAALREAVRTSELDLGSKEEVDRSQEARIAELKAENRELKLYLASLLRMLVAKGVINRMELGTLVDVIDEQETP